VLAFLDTTSLFGQNLRNFILWCAELGAFRPRWSEYVLDELDRNLDEVLGLPEAARQRLRDAMTTAFPDALVATPAAPNGFGIADPGDVPVIDAAAAARADVIVTDDDHFTAPVVQQAGVVRIKTVDFAIWCLSQLSDGAIVRLRSEFGAPEKLAAFPALQQAYVMRLGRLGLT
jgi:PIN domain